MQFNSALEHRIIINNICVFVTLHTEIVSHSILVAQFRWQIYWHLLTCNNRSVVEYYSDIVSFAYSFPSLNISNIVYNIISICLFYVLLCCNEKTFSLLRGKWWLDIFSSFCHPFFFQMGNSKNWRDYFLKIPFKKIIHEDNGDMC